MIVDVSLLLAGLIVVALLGIPLAGFLYLTHIDRSWDIFVLEIKNASEEDVEEAVADVCAHQLRAARVVPGGSAAMRFLVDCEGSYGVKVRLASGQLLEVGDLYINRGFRAHEVFTVTARGIRHQSGSASAADLAAGRRY